jgi:hypothetical protein
MCPLRWKVTLEIVYCTSERQSANHSHNGMVRQRCEWKKIVG